MIKKKIQDLIHGYQDRIQFDQQTIIAKAPGRINLIGEHTDYNGGLVLPGAIDKYFYFILHPRKDSQINAYAADLNEKYEFTVDNLKRTNELWVDFLIGILIEFKNKGYVSSGFDCILSSDVPVGAGMSSSSALECAVLSALNAHFKAGYSNWELIEMSKSSNHNFIGIKGGIMDQFASLFGQKDRVILLDCDSLQHRYFSIPENEYTWLLINTGVKHSHLTSGYNERVLECQQGLNTIRKHFPQASNLSVVTDIKHIQHLTFPSEKVKRRALYIIKENTRVKHFIEALHHSDFNKCGALLYASHDGLSNEYEVSCIELDYLVALLKDDEDVSGSRMMGGGFGGCTINLVKRNSLNSIKQKVTKAYQNKFLIQAEFYDVKISDGASVSILEL